MLSSIQNGTFVPFDLSGIPSEFPISSFEERGEYILLENGMTCKVPVLKTNLPGDTISVSEFNSIKSNAPYFLVERLPEQVEISRYLKSKGFSVEQLEKDNPKYTLPLLENEYLSKRLGDSDLQEKITTAVGKDRSELLKKYAELLADLHTVGVVYGPNHLGNFVCDKDSKIYLIDFKTSRKVDLDFDQNTSEQIINIVFDDISQLLMNLDAVKATDKEKNTALELMVGRYPISLVKKLDLIKKVKSTFFGNRAA